MKTLKFPIVLILSLTSVFCFSQTDINFKRKKLKPIQIDTTSENIFLYELPNAILYFRQKDIQNFLARYDTNNNESKHPYQLLKDTLAKGVRLIKVKDIFFSFGDRQRDSILRKQSISKSEQELNQLFHYLGADLILQNKFLIINKETGEVLSKGLLAKREKGLYGTRYIDFQMPNRKSFYKVLIVLGE